ncbi:MAG: phage tail tape measure protein, partial [Cyanobacteria bacterium J06629_18]
MAKSTRVKINFFAQTGQALAGITAIYTKTKMLTEGVGRFGQRLTGFGQTITAGVTLPIVAGLTAATKTAVDFEKELAGASRALDFSEKQAKEFSKSARTIAPSLGLAPAKFLELATTAGRLGVARKDVLEFAKNTAELGFATDTNTTFLAEKLAAIKAVFKSTNKDLKLFGANVNSLDDKVGGTSRDIIKFTARIGGVGKVAGFSSSEVAALGATFLKLGVNVSAAGTGANTMLLHLASATTLSEKAQNAFEALGLTADQVEQMMRTDPKKGLLQFLKIANNFKGDKLGTLNAIFGKQHGYKIVSLSQAYEELGRAFGIVGNKSASLAKLQAETDKRLASNAGKIEIFKAQMSALAITVGTALLPALNYLLVKITPLIVKFAGFAENNPKLVTMGIIIGGLVAAIGPLLIIIGSVISAVSAIAPVAAAAGAAIGSIATIGAKFTGLLFVLKAVGAGIAAIGGFTFKLISF